MAPFRDELSHGRWFRELLQKPRVKSCVGGCRSRTRARRTREKLS